MKKSYIHHLKTLPCKLAIFLIKIYQLCISPLYGTPCRFLPSCSQYAVQALQTHGILRGFVLVVWRLLRCQPLCKGGYDPVPPAKAKDHRKGALT